MMGWHFLCLKYFYCESSQAHCKRTAAEQVGVLSFNDASLGSEVGDKGTKSADVSPVGEVGSWVEQEILQVFVVPELV